MFTELFKHENTFASLPGDFTYWHQNRKKYSVWAIEPQTVELNRRFNTARAHLGDFLLQEYPRQVHVTIGQCGFIAKEKKYKDDYDQSMFLGDIEALKRADIDKIRLSIQGVLTSYAIAPFFPVLDTHADLISLHKILTHTANENHIFTPHVTVGLYKDAWPTKDIHQSLLNFPKQLDLTFELPKIKLLSYHPAELGGALTEEACFDFATQSFSVNETLFA